MVWKIGLLIASLWVSIAHASIESWSDKTICRVLESHADEQVYIDEAIARGLPCAPEANASANTERNQDAPWNQIPVDIIAPQKMLDSLATNPVEYVDSCISESQLDAIYGKGIPPNKNAAQIADCLINSSFTDTPPKIVASAMHKQRALADVEAGFQVAIEKLGNIGPVYAFLIGANDRQSDLMAEAYCQARSAYMAYSDDEFLSRCVEEKSRDYARFDCCGAAHDPKEPFAPVPYQSMSFSEANTSAKEGRLVATAAHEYVHVFQSAYVIWGNDHAAEEAGITEAHTGPVWLEEGMAEYLATKWVYEAGLYPFYRNMMVEYLDRAVYIRDKYNVSLKDIETRKGQAAIAASPCDCQGALQYETAVWAALYLQQSGGPKSLEDYYKKLHKMPYDEAFAAAFNMSMEQFYISFYEFLKRPKRELLKLI